MKRNIKLLKAVADKLQRMRHKKHFDMNIYGTETECGTAACIAGHSLLMSGYKIAKYNVGIFFIDPKTKLKVHGFSAARDLLGLSDAEARTLFWRTDWPERFDSEDPKSAAKRIDYFIRTRK